MQNKLYAIGGNDWGGGGAVSTVWVYDPVLDEWDTTKAEMPTARRSLASAVVDDKIYAICGVGRGEASAVEMYDPESNTWTTKRSHPSPRQYLTAEAVNGKIFTFGGNDDKDKLHMYDPLTDTWTEKRAILWRLLTSTPNSVVVDNKIFIVGADWSHVVAMYDPASNTWHGPFTELASC